MEIATLGIDLAKSVFELCGMDTRGKVVLRKKLSRSKFAPFIAQLSRCVIGMEAGGGSHHWARKFAAYGHEVRLISPQFVKPFVKANKTDRADAEAICEAVQRPTMRFVPVKSVEQQDLQALHRVRERLVKHRTALSNEMRGLLAEYGVVLPKTIAVLKQYLRTELEEADGELTAQGIELLRGLQQELAQLEAHIERVETKIQAMCQAHPVCHRLLSIPGVGPLSATATVAAIGAAEQFKNGREFAAYLGLVPRQHSSGGKAQLLGISKRGDSYLRKLLIHGARTVLQWAHKYTDRRSQWVQQVQARRGTNRALVALANKNARVLWVLMMRDERYHPVAAV